jgi:putative CocE/NonD family hydrolase
VDAPLIAEAAGRRAFASRTLGVEVVHDVQVPMRDGVVLSADVYLPPSAAAAPALLLRTPYGKRVAEHEGYAHPVWYARQGFAVVCQDVRGCFDSEGTFRPFHQEALDGHDTIEWIARQRWCDGRVGTYGFSYPGATQLLAAAERPPHLAAMAPGMTGSSYHEGWTYRGGALQLAFVLSWAALLGRDQAVRAGDGDAALRLDAALADASALYGHLPVARAMAGDLDRHAPFLAEWLAHPDYDDYWRATAPKERYDAVGVPALHVAGWYDVFLEGTLENHAGLVRAGAPGQELIVGPWRHLPWTAYQDGVDFGPEARNAVDEAQARFFRRTLLDEPSAGEPPVRVFVMGENAWRGLDAWPPPARPLTLYLRSDGRANSLNGTGTLSGEPPGPEEPADVWASDPRSPVLSLGGRSTGSATAPSGPADQRPEAGRNDVLVYTSDPLERPLTVIGAPALRLFAACDRPSGDLVARLVDVHPDGTALNVSDAGRRGALDGEAELVLSLSPTAIRFAAGHRIRLELAGSSFPMYDRNPGTGRAAAHARIDELRVTTQVLFHDAARASHLALPVAA